MSTTENAAIRHRQRAYRRRLVAKGRIQFIADLPRETLAYLDELRTSMASITAARCSSNSLKKGGQPPSNNSPETRKTALQGGLYKFVTGLFRRPLGTCQVPI